MASLLEIRNGRLTTRGLGSTSLTLSYSQLMLDVCSLLKHLTFMKAPSFDEWALSDFERMSFDEGEL